MKIQRIEFYRAIDKYTGRPYVERPAAIDEDPSERIPPDMLRYDGAFVNPDYPGIVVFIKWAGVTLGEPTLARWSSFSITLRPISSEDAGVPSDLWLVKAAAAGWITYRHPKDAQGATDYTTLTPIPLTTFLSAKRAQEVL